MEVGFGSHSTGGIESALKGGKVKVGEIPSIPILMPDCFVGGLPSISFSSGRICLPS